jgi:hypothetical protein
LVELHSGVGLQRGQEKAKQRRNRYCLGLESSYSQELARRWALEAQNNRPKRALDLKLMQAPGQTKRSYENYK